MPPDDLAQRTAVEPRELPDSVRGIAPQGEERAFHGKVLVSWGVQPDAFRSSGFPVLHLSYVDFLPEAERLSDQACGCNCAGRLSLSLPQPVDPAGALHGIP